MLYKVKVYTEHLNAMSRAPRWFFEC